MPSCEATIVQVPRVNGVTAPLAIVQMVGVADRRETVSDEDAVALIIWVEESTRIDVALRKVMLCANRVRWVKFAEVLAA